MNGLPYLANNLAAQGRGPDQMLVHMSPREVGGLQSLAQAAGGSLTINPTTGLPEAGFLDNMLPTILGLGASFLFPAASPWLIGGGIGAVEGIRKKDLGAGLLAGLGAAGGAGIGGAFGAGSAAGASASGAAPIVDATLAQGSQAVPGLTAQTASTAGAIPPAPFSPTALGSGATPTFSSLGMPSTAAAPIGSAGVPTMGSGGFANTFGSPAQLTAPATAGASTPPNFLDRYVSAMGGPKLAAAGGFGAVSPMLEPEPVTFPGPKDPYANYKGPVKPSDRRVSYPDQLSSREFMYFDPSNPIPYADGGEVDENQLSGVTTQIAPSTVKSPIGNLMAGALKALSANDTSRAIRRPGADYNVNQGEFDYNFRPVEVGNPKSFSGWGKGGSRSTGSPTSFGGKGGTSSSFERAAGEEKELGKYTDLSGYSYDPSTQRLVRMAKGGAVPMLEDGGFVLTKRAVDGLGGGSNNRGQRAAAVGLGALPIKGRGTGTSDSIKTSIEGKTPARVSNGEAYVPKRKVQKAGGSQALYALMKKAERRK